MKKTLVFAVVLVWCLALLNTGCKDTITGDDIDSRFIPSKNVSFNEHIQPIFQVKCSFSGCHNGSDRAGGLALINYGEVTANISLVVPGDAETSVLYWTVSGNAGSRNMPPINSGYKPLTDEQVEGIRVWINEGARAN